MGKEIQRADTNEIREAFMNTYVDFDNGCEHQSSIRVLVPDRTAFAMNMVKRRNRVVIETIAIEGSKYLSHSKSVQTVPEDHVYIEISKNGSKRLDLGKFWKEVDKYTKKDKP